MKHAYVFPGQGAQFTGMGKDLYDADIEARGLFKQADKILQFDLTRIMFEGSEEDLRATCVTQPAVFVHSVIGALCAIKSGAGPRPDMMAGHSLGEFSALVVSGCLSFEHGLRVVQIRANAMQEACEVRPSTMAAVLGLTGAEVEAELRITNEGFDRHSERSEESAGCSRHSERSEESAGKEGTVSSGEMSHFVRHDATVIPSGARAAGEARNPLETDGGGSKEEIPRCPRNDGGEVVVVANYNSLKQIVIAGTELAVARACERLKAAGAKRTVPLKVGGAFHSPLMEPAVLNVTGAALSATFGKPWCPVYQNVDARAHTDPEEIRRNVIRQLTAPVLWSQTVEQMRADGMTSFEEFGPGKVLTRLMEG